MKALTEFEMGDYAEYIDDYLKKLPENVGWRRLQIEETVAEAAVGAMGTSRFVKDGEIRLYTKSGGILVGTIENGTIKLQVPGRKALVFNKTE